MVNNILDTVSDGGSSTFELRFYAEGDSQTPSTVKYTLRDAAKEIINGKEDIELTPVSSTMYLALDGADFPNDTNDIVPIYLYVSFTYTSSLTGTERTPLDKYIIYVKPIP